MPKYRSVIIGCGGRAYGHANAYQHISQAQLVACANCSDTNRREKFAETFGITGYADAEQMLRTEQSVSENNSAGIRDSSGSSALRAAPSRLISGECL